MSIVIKPTDEKSNFRSLAVADYKWMVVASVTYEFTAFEDNTRLFVNGSFNTTLSKQTITDVTLSAGDIVSSDKSISFAAKSGSKTGICYGWEGTIFGHRIDRYSPTIYITATKRDATVTITRQTGGTVVVSNASVAKDSLYSYTASDTDDQYIITSNYPIACYVDDKENLVDSRDSLPIFPPATDLFGTFSTGGHIIASQASTSYNGYGTGGTTISGTLSSIGSATQTVIAGGNNFAGESARIIADKPIFAESQADGDGGEMTPFVTKEAFGTQFVIPSGENEWVKLVSDVPANYEVFNTSGTSVGTGTLAGVDISGVEGGIYNAYLGSATAGSSLTAQGNLIVTDQPVYAVYEASGDDETVLFAKGPVNNTSINVNPKIVTDGLTIYLDAANTKSYPGSGATWTDLTGNGYNATLVNSPTHNTDIGYISFNGTNQYANHTVPQLTTGTDSFTFEVWFKMRTLPTAEYETNGHIWGGENGNDVVMYVNPDGLYTSSGQSQLNLVYDDSRYYSDATAHFTDGTITADTWVHWVCQGRASDDTIAHYLNGSLDQTFSSVKVGQEAKPRNSDAMIAYDSRYSKYSTLDCAVIKEYNRILTAEEVAQNFNALRSRFGI